MCAHVQLAIPAAVRLVPVPASYDIPICQSVLKIATLEGIYLPFQVSQTLLHKKHLIHLMHTKENLTASSFLLFSSSASSARVSGWLAAAITRNRIGISL